MKKLLLSAAVLALSAGGAFAADLPSRKAPVYIPPPPPPMWTGFYVGLNAGGTWTDDKSGYLSSTPGGCTPIYPGCLVNPNSSLVLSAATNSYLSGNGNGQFLGGGQVGYNYQFYQNFLIGLEADIQGFAGSTNNLYGGGVFKNPSFVDVVTQSTSATRSIDYLGTVRGRLGWLFTPTLLAYATGGLAYGNVNLQGSVSGLDLNDPGLPNPYFASGSYSDTRVGWTAGGGVEWMFMPNWSAKIEYLYYDLGTAQAPLGALANFAAAPAVPGLYSSVFPQLQSKFNGHIVRAGVNYHFNWAAPAPVVAKY